MLRYAERAMVKAAYNSISTAELSSSRLSCLYLPPFSPGVGLRGAPSEGKGEAIWGEPYVARRHMRRHPKMLRHTVTCLWFWLAQYPSCGRVFRKHGPEHGEPASAADGRYRPQG